MSGPAEDITSRGERREKEFRRARVAASLLRPAVRAFSGRVDHGLENLPAEGPAVIAAYHASLFDPLLVALAIWDNGRFPHFMAKDSLFKGALGKILLSLGQIPVIRHTDSASAALVHAREALEDGEVVVVYTDGTLTKDPDLWPGTGKSGAARLALETGAPLIPVAHWGANKVMPRRSKLIRPRPHARVTVIFGPPIDLTGFSLQEPGSTSLREATSLVQATLARLVAGLSRRPLPERFETVLQKHHS